MSLQSKAAAVRLILFDVDGAELTNQRAMPLLEGTQPAEIKDAEGLTNFGGDVFVVGSHSRRSWDKKDPRCTTDDQRRVFALLRRQGKGTYVAEHTQESALFRFFRLTTPEGERAVPTSSDGTMRRRAAKAGRVRGRTGIRSNSPAGRLRFDRRGGFDVTQATARTR